MCDEEAEEISDKVIDRYNRKKEDVWGIGGRYLSAGYGAEQPDDDNEDDLMREGDPLSLDQLDSWMDEVNEKCKGMEEIEEPKQPAKTGWGSDSDNEDGDGDELDAMLEN